MADSSVSMVWQAMAVAFGGALGSLCRFGVSRVLVLLGWSSVPWSTLLVNLTGSFLIGRFYAVWERSAAVGAGGDASQVGSEMATAAATQLSQGFSSENVAALMVPFFVTGVLGGFTTFSALMMETLRLTSDSSFGSLGFLNVVVQLVLGLILVHVGYRWV